jgi:hypothetical protein
MSPLISRHPVPATCLVIHFFTSPEKRPTAKLLLLTSCVHASGKKAQKSTVVTYEVSSATSQIPLL